MTVRKAVLTPAGGPLTMSPKMALLASETRIRCEADMFRR